MVLSEMDKLDYAGSNYQYFYKMMRKNIFDIITSARTEQSEEIHLVNILSLEKC
jgi:hypothetical protein